MEVWAVDHLVHMPHWKTFSKSSRSDKKVKVSRIVVSQFNKSALNSVAGVRKPALSQYEDFNIWRQETVDAYGETDSKPSTNNEQSTEWDENPQRGDFQQDDTKLRA